MSSKKHIQLGWVVRWVHRIAMPYEGLCHAKRNQPLSLDEVLESALKNRKKQEQAKQLLE
jgi:hypothetical protein